MLTDMSTGSRVGTTVERVPPRQSWVVGEREVSGCFFCSYFDRSQSLLGED